MLPVLLAGIAGMGLGVACAAGEDIDTPKVATAEDSGDPDSFVEPPPPDEDTGAPAEDTGAPPDDTGSPPAADYPPGPYGNAVGQTMANHSWQGYRNGTGPWTTIKMGDYYDPDGKKGITAIKVNLAAVW